jgi:hypothetical protein
MKMFRVVTYVLVLFFLFSFSSHAWGAKYADDRIIVKFKESVSLEAIQGRKIDSINSLRQKFKVKEFKQACKKTNKKHAVDRIYIVRAEKGIDIKKMVTEFGNDPTVEYAELDYVAGLFLEPNDPHFRLQWGLYNSGQTGGTPNADIYAPEAWDLTTGGENTIVAVIDTGVQLNHPDINTKMVNGYNFVNNDYDPSDDHGHGTHVAGIIAANTNNNIGMSGICWGCRIMPIKVLDNNGAGYASTIATGILYAVDNGARIINLSLGTPSYSLTLWYAVKYAYDAGVVVVSAMGNSSDNTVFYPARFKESISVGSTNHTDRRSYFSTYGTHIDIVAPGQSILSAYNDNTFMYMSGTSMAAPFVSGVVGLLLSKNPLYTPNQVKWLLEVGADDVVGDVLEDTAGWDQYMGAGRLNAYNSLQTVSAGLALSMDADYDKSNIKTVSPAEGNESSLFTYKIIYFSDNNIAPNLVSVCIDNSCFAMDVDISASSMLRDGNYANGEQYVYKTNLPYGKYKHYFLASNGVVSNRYPKDGFIFAPAVIDNIPPSGAIIINSDDIYTKTPNVMLFPACGDNGGSGCADMMFSNDNLNWSSVEPFSESPKQWVVSSGDGKKTVYAKYKDVSGNWSTAFSDSIIFDSTAPVTMPSLSGETYTTAQNVYLICRDTGGAGCQKTYYCVGSNCSPNIAYSSAIRVSSTMTIRYYSIDKAGNAEEVKTKTYIIVVNTLPDLIVSSLNAPTLAEAGLAINITNTVKNNKSIGAGAFFTAIYLSTNSALDSGDIYLGEREFSPLTGFASSSKTTSVLIPSNTPSGTYYIIVKADSLNMVSETNEGNNVRGRIIKIGPDLSVSSLGVPLYAKAGGSINILEATMNIGGGQAGATTTSYYLSKNNILDENDLLIDSRVVPSLARGGFNAGNTIVRIPLGLPSGSYYIIAKADSLNTVSEVTENNNTKVRMLLIQ